MRIERSVTSLSWIPSEAVTGLNKAAFGSGFTHYDEPPPDHIENLDALRDSDRFRFANNLSAWVELDDDAGVVEAGYCGGCVMGSTTIALGPKHATFVAVGFPVIQQPVVIENGSATFVQTVGGRTALPAPRRIKHAPFVAFEAPPVWTTLSLTVHPDGSSTQDLVGASAFPRHWVYDHEGALTAKAGLADFKDWYRTAFGKHTPWGDEDSPTLVTAVETALEREIAGGIMSGGRRPTFRTFKEGDLLTEQGGPGDEVFLLLNGVLQVEIDGEPVAEVGPGAILGERAALEGTTRTSTLRALTRGKVAVVTPDEIDREALLRVSGGHRRETAPVTGDAGSG
jgi:hypothetical protein